MTRRRDRFGFGASWSNIDSRRLAMTIDTHGNCRTIPRIAGAAAGKMVPQRCSGILYGVRPNRSLPGLGLARPGVQNEFDESGVVLHERRQPQCEMTVTVADAVATLAGLAKGRQRGAHGAREDVSRVSGRASRARRRLSKSGDVASDRGRLRGQDLQSWCLRNPYGSVTRRRMVGLGWTI